MTVAATTPVAAASSVPTSTTAAATPPRSAPISIPTAFSSRSAMPDRSRIAPISTNSGTASSTGSLMNTNHFPGRVLSVAVLNAPVISPMNANAKAVAANENATL